MKAAAICAALKIECLQSGIGKSNFKPFWFQIITKAHKEDAL